MPETVSPRRNATMEAHARVALRGPLYHDCLLASQLAYLVEKEEKDKDFIKAQKEKTNLLQKLVSNPLNKHVPFTEEDRALKKDFLHNLRVKRVHPIHRSPCCVSVLESKDPSAPDTVVFAGTTMDGKDLLVDATSIARRKTEHGDVPVGFYDQLHKKRRIKSTVTHLDDHQGEADEAIVTLRDVWRDKRWHQEITQFIQEHCKGKKIVITGHSMGGALAMLYAESLSRNPAFKDRVELITIGKPLVGKEIAQYMEHVLGEDPITNLVHGSDLMVNNGFTGLYAPGLTIVLHDNNQITGEWRTPKEEGNPKKALNLNEYQDITQKALDNLIKNFTTLSRLQVREHHGIEQMTKRFEAATGYSENSHQAIPILRAAEQHHTFPGTPTFRR